MRKSKLSPVLLLIGSTLKKASITSALIIVSVGSGGCLDRTIILKEVDNFNASIQAGADATASYYRELNDQDKRLYAHLLALNPQCRVGDTVDPNCTFLGIKSPLSTAQLPEESLQARLALLKTLAKYGKALANLAADKSSSDYATNVDSLKANFLSLESKFSLLSSSTQGIDSNVESRYVTPITSILKTLGQSYVESRQWSAIRNAIISASPNVNILLDSLKKDLAVMNNIVPLNEDAAFSSLISYYNKNKTSMSLEQRKAILTEILRIQSNLVTARANSPVDLINDIQLIHKKLVVAAQNDAQPQTISDLRVLLDRYSQRLQDFRAAVLLLSNSK